MNKNNVKKEGEFSNIFNILKRRKFKGNTGTAVKNSAYQFSTILISKIGSLIFTIILARLLLPELFGLYGLALSTILLLGSFSDLGINKALIRYIPKYLEKGDNKKAKAYFMYLVKLKSFLVGASAVLILLLANFISQTYYQKPLFLSLLAGALYIIVVGFLSFIDFIFYASNKFRSIFYKEIFLQLLRVTIVPLAVLLTIKYSFSNGVSIFMIIAALTLAYFLILIPLIFIVQRKVNFLREKSVELTKKEKKSINKFILPLSATVLSGLFFGYIDIVMLGRYVLAENIGYYKAAFSLIGALVPLIGFSVVLLPIFSSLKGKRLEEGFNKSAKAVALLSLLGVIGTLIFSNLAINIIFGGQYSPSINILRILSVLLIALPLASIYDSYFIAKGNTKLIAKLLGISVLINILLNYILITWLIQYSNTLAVFGAAIATIISRYFYLFMLMIFRKY